MRFELKHQQGWHQREGMCRREPALQCSEIMNTDGMHLSAPEFENMELRRKATLSKHQQELSVSVVTSVNERVSESYHYLVAVINEVSIFLSLRSDVFFIATEIISDINRTMLSDVISFFLSASTICKPFFST